MISLPVEILQSICEFAAERVVADTRFSDHDAIEVVNSGDIHFGSLLGFSQASWACRRASAPYIFRRVRVKTTEQASMIIKSSVGQYARHVHFPVIDTLTSRRPIPSSVLKLVSQAISMRISAGKSSFFYTAQTPLSSLLRSAGQLLKLELYCEPITYGYDTLGLIGRNLIPTCPKSLRALYITMPGGQPDYTGPGSLLGALSSHASVDRPLSALESLHLSVHLSAQFASRPEQLALGIAQRLPALRHVSLVALSPQTRQKASESLFELIGQRSAEPQDRGRSERSITSWRVLRGACADSICVGSQDESGITLEASIAVGG